MANFIQETDYEVQARQEILKLLDTTDDRAAILKAERFAISQIRKYIGGRYDCDTIFSAVADLRDDYIIMITIDIALYHLWAKKAPKSIPSPARNATPMPSTGSPTSAPARCPPTSRSFLPTATAETSASIHCTNPTTTSINPALSTFKRV